MAVNVGAPAPTRSALDSGSYVLYNITMSATLNVGDRLWYYDVNRRKYTTPSAAEKAAGKIWGDIIWIEHWKEQEIVGETRVSWIVGPCATKLPKRDFLNGETRRGWLRSREDVERAAWVHEHRVEIHDRVRRCRDKKKLPAVAAALGAANPEADHHDLAVLVVRLYDDSPKSYETLRAVEVALA
jgi:hypothetical protein